MTKVDGWQGLAALVGITIGVVPGVQYAVRGHAGSAWGLVLDDPAGTAGWVAPLVVVVVAVLVIAVLEVRGKRP